MDFENSETVLGNHSEAVEPLNIVKEVPTDRGLRQQDTHKSVHGILPERVVGSGSRHIGWFWKTGNNPYFRWGYADLLGLRS